MSVSDEELQVLAGIAKRLKEGNATAEDRGRALAAFPSLVVHVALSDPERVARMRASIGAVQDYSKLSPKERSQREIADINAAIDDWNARGH